MIKIDLYKFIKNLMSLKIKFQVLFLKFFWFSFKIIMKVIVIFDRIRIVVPCNESKMKVYQIQEKAITRYKKIINKVNDSIIPNYKNKIM